MKISQNQWMYRGAAILAAVSMTIIFKGTPSIWTPMPVPLFVVGFLTIVLFPFVTPVFYVLVLKLFFSSEHFPILIFILVASLSILDYYFIQDAWEWGIRYQGLVHTKVVALENIIGFGLTGLISLIAVMLNSKKLALTANLLLFILLSWCAFPYLGELP